MEFVEATSRSVDTNRTTQVDFSGKKKQSLDENLKGFFGMLDVYIRQARDIHNICIYQNQDVYAKLWLTNDPEHKVSTRIINHGGRNPIFDENVQFNVGATNSTLRCEVWMLSRIRNYLEDQLLGFTLVPLSAVLIKNGKLSKEFSLSSTDFLHSPAGFLQLTLTYNGASPEVVMEIPKLNSSLVTADLVDDRGSGVEDATLDLDKLDRIEFPDLEISDQNESMASEYFMIPCPDMEVKSANQEYVNVEAQVSSGIEVSYQPLSSTATKTCLESTPLNPQSAANNYASGIPETKKQDNVPDSKVEPASAEVEESVKCSTSRSQVTTPSKSLFTWPVSNVTATTTVVRQEQDVVQQEIIDMYTQSMNQFTEALAKMKLPLDIENGLNTKNAAGNSVRSDCSEHQDAPKDTSEPTSKVFYGSTAFF